MFLASIALCGLAAYAQSIHRTPAQWDTDRNVNVSYPWNYQEGLYADNMSVTAEIQINGVPVTEADRWEVGVFCGDECRGHQQGLGAGPLGLVMYLTVYGVDDDVIDFYLYDMDNDEVFLGMCSTTVPFITGYSYGEPWEPFVLNFVAAPTYTKDNAAFTELGGY